MRGVLRTEDALGRWGGEEFLVVLPRTDAEAALLIAERLRLNVAAEEPRGTAARARVTVTVGVAVWSSEGLDDLVSRADAALYAGKHAGRNNVRLAVPNVSGRPATG
jgi:diguanylate cyclase (GGDEF)-like protein